MLLIFNSLITLILLIFASILLVWVFVYAAGHDGLGELVRTIFRLSGSFHIIPDISLDEVEGFIGRVAGLSERL